jgi:Zn-dependent protease with chaperone function
MVHCHFGQTHYLCPRQIFVSFMHLVLKPFFLVYFFTLATSLSGQQAVYNFQQDDTLLKRTYYNQALKQKNNLVAGLDKQYKTDYKEIYEERFKAVGSLLLSSRCVTEPAANNYLQSILQKIVQANPELKGRTLRLVFTRDAWPNAYSMGEGTIAFNAGLLVYLHNEAELVFILCHELAHDYLEHGNQAIRQQVETFNSEDFKKELKRLSKQEYKVGQQLEDLVKKLAFGSRRHSRTNEAAADRQALRFMKKTGYDCNASTTCLQLLDKVDDSSLFKPLQLEDVFNFPDYTFRKRWIEKESAIFGQMSSDESPVLTKKEKDSLKTHPDCTQRIQLLQDSVKPAVAGKSFLVSETIFRQLQKDFIAEMTEQHYKNSNLGPNLYFSLLLLQSGTNQPYALYGVARCLNRMYTLQKDHRLGLSMDKEARGYPDDYNLLLRFADKLKLDELAELAYHFCKQHEAAMKAYPVFEKELAAAIKNRSNHQ